MNVRAAKIRLVQSIGAAVLSFPWLQAFACPVLPPVPTATEYVAILGDGTTSNSDCTLLPPAEASKTSSVGFSNQTGTVNSQPGLFTFESTGHTGTSGSGTLFGYTGLATLFELSGPSPSVEASLNIDYYAINELVSGLSVKGNGLVDVTFTVRNGSGSELLQDNFLFGFGDPIGTAVQGTWSTTSTNLPTGESLAMWVEVNWQVGINTNTWPNSSDFQNTAWVAFNEDNVFTFGDSGYTANASEVNIINNQWLGAAVVPVPASMWLFASGLLGLIGISKRRK